MSKFGGVLALVLIVGVLLFGIVWGLVTWAATLLGVVFLAGFAGDLISGSRVRASLILPAGLVGVLIALAAVDVLRLPALVSLAGVPVVWAVLGATAAILAGGGVAARRGV